MKTVTKGLLGGAAALTLAFGAWLAPGALGMGGEDVIYGRPWHHLDTTLRSLAGDRLAVSGAPAGAPVVFAGADFSRGAAMSIAWHADYIDSYLNNPLWWMSDPLSKRFKASISMFDHLGAMHHDDTFTAGGINDNWNRYLSGALVGLYQAAQADDVPAAHHILGVTAHAIQDFYSHSNWMDDPARRGVTWFEAAPGTRATYAMMTGAYQYPASHAPFHHGAYSLSCSAIHSAGIGGAMDVLCGGVSPFSGTSMCIAHRGCKDGAPVETSVLDSHQPGLLYLSPKGVALDTVWQSKVGAEVRGITGPTGAYVAGRGGPRLFPDTCEAIVNFGATCDHATPGDPCTRGGIPRMCERDSDYLFAETKVLAGRSTDQFIRLIRQAMFDLDPASGDRYETFWARVKTESTTLAQRTAQFEDFSKLGFQYASAGKYPVMNAASPGRPYTPASDGWYVRVRIRTSGDFLSGTDGDVMLRVETAAGTREFPLDYLPMSDAGARVSSPLLVYNDFERNDDDVYTVGPLPGRPMRVTLTNGAGDAGAVIEAALNDVAHWLDGAVTDIRRAIISIVGGNADPLGETIRTYSAEELRDRLSFGASTRADTMLRDAGDEGQYELRYSYRMHQDGLTPTELGEGWRNFEFTLNQLHCIRESTVDRLTWEDEPLIFVSFAPLNGLADATVQGYRAGPFEGVDTGETLNLPGPRTFTVKLPPNGAVTLALQQFESDDENDYDRDQLYRTFIDGIDEGVRRGNATFYDAAGRALAVDWKVDRLEVTPFLRGPRPEVAPTLTATDIGWINGGQSRTFTMPAGAPRALIPAGRPGVNEWQYFGSVFLRPDLADRVTPLPIGPGTPMIRDNPALKDITPLIPNPDPPQVLVPPGAPVIKDNPALKDVKPTIPNPQAPKVVEPPKPIVPPAPLPKQVVPVPKLPPPGPAPAKPQQ